MIEEACKTADNLFGPSVRPSNLNLASRKEKASIPSPLKESLADTTSPSKHPEYSRDWHDDHGVHWIEFKGINESITTTIPRSEVESLLDIRLSSDGNLVLPTAMQGSKKADFIYRNLDNIVPSHFFPKHVKFYIHALTKNTGKKEGKRGGKAKSHPYLIHFRGVCCADVDGCPAEYDAGITESDVLRYAEGKTEGLLFSMSISGQCKHVWKRVYSRVRGSSRQKQVADLVDKPCNLLPPSRRAKKELVAVEKGDFAIGNHGGRATNRFTQYEMNRKAKDEYRKNLNLTDDTLTNTINMCHTLKEIDKKAREDRGDISKDYLGLVQDSGIHNGFYA